NGLAHAVRGDHRALEAVARLPRRAPVRPDDGCTRRHGHAASRRRGGARAGGPADARRHDRRPRVQVGARRPPRAPARRPQRHLRERRASRVAADCILITSSDVVRGSEDEFNRWYNEQHVPEFVACPGFLRASRYECLAGETRFYAIYEIEGPEALDTPEVRRAWGWGP